MTIKIDTGQFPDRCDDVAGTGKAQGQGAGATGGRPPAVDCGQAMDRDAENAGVGHMAALIFSEKSRGQGHAGNHSEHDTGQQEHVCKHLDPQTRFSFQNVPGEYRTGERMVGGLRRFA